MTAANGLEVVILPEDQIPWTPALVTEPSSRESLRLTVHFLRAFPGDPAAPILASLALAVVRCQERLEARQLLYREALTQLALTTAQLDTARVRIHQLREELRAGRPV